MITNQRARLFFQSSYSQSLSPCAISTQKGKSKKSLGKAIGIWLLEFVICYLDFDLSRKHKNLPFVLSCIKSYINHL
jgi:hypothetical protein